MVIDIELTPVINQQVFRDCPVSFTSRHLCQDARIILAADTRAFDLRGTLEINIPQYNKNVGRSSKEEGKTKEGCVRVNRSRKHGTSQERDTAEIH